MTNVKEAAERRRKKNEDLIKRMKDPEDQLSGFNSQLSHFPPRPPIKKDKKAIRQLFEEDE